MNTNLSNTLIVNDLALTYYDTVDEVIKELDDNFYCTLKPFSNSFYTLYLVGDLMYTSSVRVTFNLTSNDTDKLDIRAYSGEFNYNVFDDNTSSVIINYASADYKYNNAIPINIRLTSNAITQSTASLSIVLETVSGV